MPVDFLASIKKRKGLVNILLIGLILTSLFIMFGYFYRHNMVLAGERESLKATGTIEAKKIMAAFKVPGKIETILVKEGDEIQRGQEIAVLESQEIEAKLAQAQGAYEATLGKAEQADSAVPLTSQSVAAKIEQAQAAVNKAQVGLTNAKQKYDRAKDLYDGGAIAASSMDEATNFYNAAQHDLELAQGALAEAEAARIKTATMQAQYQAALGQSKMAAGAVQEAEAYLANTHLFANMDGYITQQLLEEGEMLNAGTPVFEISDLKNTYVKVFIDEKKIGRVKLGQEVDVTVDAYPEKVFKGRVIWINDAGQFAVHKAINEQYSHDIRSFEVKIDLPNEELLLKTGMTAMVNILDGE
jgi:HlyD family secretion protein